LVLQPEPLLAQDAPMISRRRLLLPVCGTLVLSAASSTGYSAGHSAASADNSYVLYRCTDAHGKVQVRDFPCPAGARQTLRRMQRIVDPTPKPQLQEVVAPAPASAPAAVPATQVVYVQPPRPMYECTTPDGQRYNSDSPEGNPRWMPLWALDVPVLTERTIHTPGGVYLHLDEHTVNEHAVSEHVGDKHAVNKHAVNEPAVNKHVRDEYAGEERASDEHRSGVRVNPGRIDRRVVPTIAAYGNAGTWVRDACSALPQQEVCARLRDRRDELRRLAFNAQPSRRAPLESEERNIDARLGADCQ